MKKRDHTLGGYLKLLDEAGLVEVSNLLADEAKNVHHLTFDSNEMDFGTLFICKGAHFKAEYLSEAREKGAICYISETKYDIDMPFIITSDVRSAMPLLADYFYEDTWQDIEMIGITGTKGKSTVTYFMKAILDDYEKDIKGNETAVISSIDTYDGVERFESHLTTPEAITLRKHIDNAVKSEIEFLTMEVSSQALKYQRTQGIIYDTACYLNLGEDHISPLEHPDFDDYATSKLILFDQSKKCIINNDSAYAEKFIERAKGSQVTEKVFTFAMENDAHLTGYDIKPSRKGIAFRAKCDDFDEEFKIGLTGIFNVSNALAAISMAYLLNIPMANIKAGLKRAKVAGRMEVFTDEKEEVTVIVDYAHNKMSMEALFDSTMKEYPNSKIWIVFGCPGKKAYGRRKVLGEIAGKYADMSFLTEEDAGEEDIHEISLEISGHVAAEGGKFEIIDDREEAIDKAIMTAEPGTVLLVTAKGRETRQKRGIEYIEVTSDVDLVKAALRKRDQM